jgi:hypothetical protein
MIGSTGLRIFDRRKARANQRGAVLFDAHRARQEAIFAPCCLRIASGETKLLARDSDFSVDNAQP